MAWPKRKYEITLPDFWNTIPIQKNPVIHNYSIINFIGVYTFSLTQSLSIRVVTCFDNIWWKIKESEENFSTVATELKAHNPLQAFDTSCNFLLAEISSLGFEKDLLTLMRYSCPSVWLPDCSCIYISTCCMCAILLWSCHVLLLCISSSLHMHFKCGEFSLASFLFIFQSSLK